MGTTDAPASDEHDVEDDDEYWDDEYDDGYDEVAPGATFALAGGGRRIEVVFVESFPAAQLFSPGTDFLCFEPMAAPTNALVEGTAQAVEPGEELRAVWELRVS